MSRRRRITSLEQDDENHGSIYTSKKGYYKLVFTTTITDASEQELEYAPLYALQLIARRLNLKPELLQLKKDKHYRDKHKVPAKVYDFAVYLGLYHIGRVRLVIQKTEYTNTINIIYKQRIGRDKYLRHHWGKDRGGKRFNTNNTTISHSRTNKFKEY